MYYLLELCDNLWLFKLVKYVIKPDNLAFIYSIKKKQFGGNGQLCCGSDSTLNQTAWIIMFY